MATFEEARKKSIEFFGGDALAADAFLKKYAVTSKDGKKYLETTPDDMWKRMAKAGAEIEKDKAKWEKKFYEIFKDFKAVPQGSIMFALGNPMQKSSCSNCFVFEVEDSLESIFDTAKEMARTYSYRGGCGLDISSLRPASAVVTNSAKFSSGAASFMNFYSDVTRMIGIHNRRGALMLTIGVDHPDVELFTTMKHDLTKVTGANVSLRITDDFMRAVEADKKWFASFKTGHETITKEWRARDLWKVIVNSATNTAEPGILFWDNIIKNSPADCYADLGFKTICTNPCSELPLSRYDSCTLLSMNLTRYTRNDFTDKALFDEKSFFEDVYVATRFLDNVKTIDADYVPLAQQKEIARKGRRIGMGIHGLADAMANLRIKYDSAEGVKFIDQLFEKYTKAVYGASVELAKEKGAFPIFDAKREKGHPFLERIGFAGIPRRNIACMTLAPTGTVSMISQTSSGIEPVFRNSYTRRKKVNHSDEATFKSELAKLLESNPKLEEQRAEDGTLTVEIKGKTVFVDRVGDFFEEYPVFEHNPKRYLEMNKSAELPDYFVTSDKIDWEKRVEIQAAITKWLDHSCSSTVNLPRGTSPETVSSIYTKAWKLGCKGITVYVDGCRDGVLVTEETKKVNKNKNNAVSEKIVRPEKIPCDIYQITADGEKWTVMIGLVDNEPYEVFCGKPKKTWLDDWGKVEKGYIEKEGHGRYSLHMGNDTVLKNVSEIFTDIQGSITRLASTLLRNGVDIHTVVQQLEKSDGNITSFNKAIARVLKKYIKEGVKEKGAKCPECSQEALIREEGCVKCTSCGWTKCM
jgi:ribonucleoside-diphosphate reductase alpha chain